MSNNQIAQDAFQYLNEIRQKPRNAIAPLQEKLKYFKGKTLYLPGQIGLMTQEGPSAYQECISFLQTQAPLPSLEWEDGLAQAANDHASDIGPKGICGHAGSDGSTMTERIERYGEWMGHIGENISFGQKTGKDVILQLIVDDGVKTRGHRKNCFKEDFKLVGIAAAKHKKYDTCCVFDFAEEFTNQDGGAADKTPKAKKRSQPQQGNAPMKNNFGSQGDMDPFKKGGFGSDPFGKGFGGFGKGFGGGFGSGFGDQGFGDQGGNGFGNDDMPEGCIGVSTQTSTQIKNGKKITTVKKTFKMQDGSTQVQTEQTIG